MTFFGSVAFWVQEFRDEVLRAVSRVVGEFRVASDRFLASESDVVCSMKSGRVRTSASAILSEARHQRCDSRFGPNTAIAARSEAMLRLYQLIGQITVQIGKSFETRNVPIALTSNVWGNKPSRCPFDMRRKRVYIGSAANVPT